MADLDYFSSMTLEEAGAIRLVAGKHKGRTLAEVASENPTYVDWCAARRASICPELCVLVDFAKARYLAEKSWAWSPFKAKANLIPNYNVAPPTRRQPAAPTNAAASATEINTLRMELEQTREELARLKEAAATNSAASATEFTT